MARIIWIIEEFNKELWPTYNHILTYTKQNVIQNVTTKKSKGHIPANQNQAVQQEPTAKTSFPSSEDLKAMSFCSKCETLESKNQL
jgi:preprotein translocase subunit SecE